MKRIKFISFAIAIVFIAFTSIISCKSAQECKGVVIVTTTDENGDKVPVAECQLTIGEPTFAEDIYRIVTTNEEGLYEGVWKHDAYLKVAAEKKINNRMVKGTSFLKLNRGETSVIEILLK